MADMSDVLEVLTNIENYLIDLPTKILLKADQIYIVNGLSDVSENLGIVTAGEFRAGNRNEPGMFLRTAVAGSGFSGMRMRYPAMSYDLDGTPTDWNLVGINDDILQFGVRASDGKLVAGGGAVILDSTGITAVGGTIAGWTIDTTELTNTKIKISSAGSIESIPFVSGIGGSGWKIGEDGNVEFNNAVIRGELRTTVLTYQEVQAVSGTMGVFQSAGVLSADLTLPAVPSGTYSIQTKAPNSTNPQIFDNNHILQIKNGTQSTWFIIDGGFGTSGDGYTWVCTYLSGTTDVTYTTGQAVISYGVSGDGFLLMEAIGTGSPYFSVRTHAGAPYTATTEHVRMGNLNGGWGYATDIYGVAIGQYASGKGNITVDPTDGIKINIYTDTIMQFNSSGAFITNVLNMTGDDAAIAIGATPPTGSAAGTGLWLSKAGLFSLASNVYQVKIDATDGKLYAGGGNVVIDADGISINDLSGFSYAGSKLKFASSGGAQYGYIAAVSAPTITGLTIVADLNNSAANGDIWLKAVSGASGVAGVKLIASQPTYGDTQLELNSYSTHKYFRFSGGHILLQDQSSKYAGIHASDELAFANTGNLATFLRSDGSVIPITPCPPWKAVMSYSNIFASYCPLQNTSGFMRDESYLSRHLTPSASSVTSLYSSETISDYLIYYRSNGTVHYSNATQGTAMNYQASISFIMWFKPTSVGVTQGLFRFGTTTANTLAYISAANKVIFDVYTSGSTVQTISTNSIVNNEWNYVKLFFIKNGLAYIDLNGTKTEYASTTPNENLKAASGDFRLGHENSAGFFSGVLGFFVASNYQAETTLDAWVDMSRPWHGH